MTSNCIPAPRSKDGAHGAAAEESSQGASRPSWLGSFDIVTMQNATQQQCAGYVKRVRTGTEVCGGGPLPFSAAPLQLDSPQEFKDPPQCVYNTNGTLFAVIQPHQVDLYQVPPPVSLLCGKIQTSPTIASSLSSPGIVPSYDPYLVLPQKNVSWVAFSNSGKFIYTYERLHSRHVVDDNIKVWKLANDAGTDCVDVVFRGFSKDLNDAFHPIQFHVSDEFILHYKDSAVHLYDSEKLVASASLSVTPFLVAEFPVPIVCCLSPVASSMLFVFLKSVKAGDPSRLALYDLEALKHLKASRNAGMAGSAHTSPTALVQKAVFKCDQVAVKWNGGGSCVLVESLVLSDQSNQNYYGESHLYMLTAQDPSGSSDSKRYMQVSNATTVDFQGNPGPIHDFAFTPKGLDFIVIQGFQPAKSLFYGIDYRSGTSKPTKELCVAPRNTVRFSPNGGRFCIIAGFGNLSSGHIDFWDIWKFKLIGQQQERDGIKLCEFTPDGRHVVGAVMRPWRRVSNKLVLWSYGGELEYEEKIDELYGVYIQPGTETIFPNRPQSPRFQEKRKEVRQQNAALSDAKTASGTAAKEKYIPPALRTQLAAGGQGNVSNSVSASIEQARGERVGPKKLIKTVKVEPERSLQQPDAHHQQTSVQYSSAASNPNQVPNKKKKAKKQTRQQGQDVDEDGG